MESYLYHKDVEMNDKISETNQHSNPHQCQVVQMPDRLMVDKKMQGCLKFALSYTCSIPLSQRNRLLTSPSNQVKMPHFTEPLSELKQSKHILIMLRLGTSQAWGLPSKVLHWEGRRSMRACRCRPCRPPKSTSTMHPCLAISWMSQAPSSWPAVFNRAAMIFSNIASWIPYDASNTSGLTAKVSTVKFVNKLDSWTTGLYSGGGFRDQPIKSPFWV